MADVWNRTFHSRPGVIPGKNYFLKLSSTLESFYIASIRKMEKKLQWVTIVPKVDALTRIIRKNSRELVTPTLPQGIQSEPPICAFPACTSRDGLVVRHGYNFCPSHRPSVLYSPHQIETSSTLSGDDDIRLTGPETMNRLPNAAQSSVVLIPGALAATTSGNSYPGVIDYDVSKRVTKRPRRMRTCRNCKGSCYGATNQGRSGLNCKLDPTSLPPNSCLFLCAAGCLPRESRCNGGYVNICKTEGRTFTK